MKVQRTITVTLIIDAKRLDKVRTQLARDLVGESSLLDSITFANFCDYIVDVLM